jgi:hypothetical protein
MIPYLMTFLHLIPLMMTIWICLLMTCLTILLHGPHRAAMILLSVWLVWKLKSNVAGDSLPKRGFRVSPQ